MKGLFCLLSCLAIFSLVSSAKKPKGKKPTKPELLMLPFDHCLTCLQEHAPQCIPDCGPPRGYGCAACVNENAPECLRACGYSDMATHFNFMAQPAAEPDCVQYGYALPLGTYCHETKYVERQTVIHSTAAACGYYCANPGLPGHSKILGWSWSNLKESTSDRFTCWCLNQIGTLTPDVTRDSSVNNACPAAA